MVISYDTGSIMGCRMDLTLKGETDKKKETPKDIELGTIESNTALYQTKRRLFNLTRISDLIKVLCVSLLGTSLKVAIWW
jgi:hypothetical protein